MKSKIKRHSRSVLAVILTLSMLVSCMMVGLIATDAAKVQSESVGAQKNLHWQAKELYFVVPDSWDLDTYSHVQVDITRTTSATDSKYQTFSSDMTRIGTSRLYYIALNIDHSTWNQNEFIAFTANSSKYGDGTFTLNSNHYYTTPKDYGVNSSSNYYVAVPDSDANACTVSMNWNANRDTLMKKTQAANVYTNKASSSTGGSVSLTGYYFTSDTAIASSSDTPSYDAVLGTTMTMTATANTGYTFDGWYSDSSCTNKLSSSTTYSYTVSGAKTVYANFTSSASSASYSLTGNIDSTYIASINGVANTLARGSSSDADWWKAYHSEAAINQPGSSANVYSITFTTVDAATLKANNHSVIDIGLSTTAGVQKAFQIGGTYYNYIGGDYKVTSAGVTDQNIVDLAPTNGGGSLIIQPGRTYTLTVNESNNTFSIKCDSGDKYFLAGQYSDGTAQFFGETWNTSKIELLETSAGSGVYEKTFTTNIPAGNILFKVVKNGDTDGWSGGSYPDSNQSYKINANATEVKFSFNKSTGKITVTQQNSGGGSASGWLYSKDAAPRSEVTPTSGMITFDASKENDNEYGKFRFMYGTTSDGLNNVIIPSNYKTGTSSNAYWAELTESMNNTTGNYYFCLSNFWGKTSIVGDANTEINDSSTDKEIKDANNSTLFHIQTQQNGSIHDSIKFVLIRGVDWNKVAAIGVKAWDNTKATNSSNPRNNKVDYQIYYKEKGSTPVTEAKVVDIIAKNGTLRDNDYNRFTNLADTDILDDYFYYAETNASDGTVTEYNSISAYNTAHSSKRIVVTHENAYGNSTYDKMTNVPVGAKIKLQTTLSSSSSTAGSFDSKAFKDTHYLKAYSFNGMTYEVHTPNTGGVYEEIWTVRAVNTTYTGANDILQNATTDGKTVEVTPIYYMKDNKNCKTFYIDGYDGEVQNAWGNMLCVYPYYENVSSKDNAFGGYPGQPMLFWGGKYQMEIPLTVDGTANGASVKGLTLHNAFWDLLHRSIDIRCNARNHAQTYDYDDFYKLYKEKNPDTIIFDFKYRKTHDNYTDGYNYTNYSFAGSAARTASEYEASTHNGVELVTDYFGRQVDAFGNLITDANQSHYGEDNGSGGTVGQTKELLFVSTGYKDTYVGEYATLWAVYAPSEQMKGGDTANKFIGYISSSMLYLNNIDRRLQYTGGDDTSSGRMSWSSFINTYNHLKTNYVGVPALISYEKEIWNDSKDKANRSDGKWYYSNKSDKVAASIKIQYGSHTLMDAPDHSVSSDAWHDDPFDDSQTGVGGEKNIGTGTGCSAYFTNTTPNLMGKVASGEQFADSTKSFTFLAVPSGSYMFAGWVRYSNGKYYEISEKEAAESPMSANDVYIARFVDAQTGSLTIQHVTEKTDTFNGTGTPSVTVSVKNASGTEVFTDTKEDGSKIDISNYINSHFKDYKIDISLTTTPDTENFMKEIVSSSGNFAPGTSKWNEDKTPTNSAGADTTAKTVSVAQFTVQDILDSGVTSLRYVSHLMMPKYTYNYEITYTYYSRFWGQQSYTQTGTCEEGDFTGAKDTATLTTDFIINKTPYEKTFREQINWNYTTSTVEAGDYDAAPMVNNAAGTAASANTYKMTAHVYASKQVNDRVTAEFVLPYYYNDKSQGYTVHDADVYANAEKPHGQYETEHSYLYDTSHESVTLDTQAYKLFTYDGGDVGGGDNVLASQTHLMEAAPYLMMDGDADHKIQYHYQLVDKSRTYTGNSFKVGEVTYYLNERPEGVPDDNYHKVINSSNVDQDYTVTFTKIKYQGTDHKTTYKYAVAEGTEGTYGYKIYFFSYKMNDQEQMVDNEGNVTTTPVFNGQYVVYSVDREIDGIIKNTGVKKYFTRWDITNTKGDFVASCYNRRFNYSGYDNYVIKPIYDSDTENNYASSLGTDIGSSITYLDDSRNQWKGTGASGSYASTTGQTDLYAADKLFTDFAITYSYNGENINTVSPYDSTSGTGADIKIGVVIERLDSLDKVGSAKITSASYYADKYKTDTDWENLATALKNGTTLTDAVSGDHKCYNSKIGANVSGFGTQFGERAPGAVSGQTSVIDNFNRLQWFYTFNNTTQKTDNPSSETVTDMKNYAYRAISYMIVTDSTGTHATLTDTPAYFTIYDTATRTGN